jgi:uncharacterized protein (AIM24 family)
MSRSTVEEFVNATSSQAATTGHAFELENPYTLRVNLDGKVWAKLGSMIGHRGKVEFAHQGIFEQGIGNLLKKMVTDEEVELMKVKGKGTVYLADDGKRVQILTLGARETIFVNGNDLLAMEDSVEYKIKMMRRIASWVTGGLFNIRVTGPGMVAITTYYQPITLRVAKGDRLYTDPRATVAWSGSLSPGIHTDVSFQHLLGRSSEETFQLEFDGEGWVVLQPYEEDPPVDPAEATEAMDEAVEKSVKKVLGKAGAED